MNQRPASGHKSRQWFQIVALVALVAAVVQVTLGGVVRVTDSGLGCPDWPLCHDQIVPHLEYHTLIEYFHRLSAAVLGLLVLALAGLAWRSYRTEDRITVSSTVALALVVAAALLGGATVLAELEWWVVLVHLGVAEGVVACLVVAVMAGRGVPGRADDRPAGGGSPGGAHVLVSSMLAATFALILAGSYMVGQGYGAVCGSWPLCDGSLLPDGEAAAVHMSHRLGVLVLGVLIAATATSIWSHRPVAREMRWAILLVAGLYIFQVLVGTATVWTDFATALKSFHLTVATLLWVSVVLLATLNFAPGRFEARGVQGSSETRSGLGGVVL